MGKLTPKFKGDAFDITINIPEDITNWKIRCEIYDDTTNRVQLATANSGGATSQIEVTEISSTLSTFIIHVANDLTTDFDDKSHIEIQVETDDSPSKIYTTMQADLELHDRKISWSEPE